MLERTIISSLYTEITKTEPVLLIGLFELPNETDIPKFDKKVLLIHIQFVCNIIIDY